jgi:hypothetical protein
MCRLNIDINSGTLSRICQKFFIANFLICQFVPVDPNEAIKNGFETSGVVFFRSPSPLLLMAIVASFRYLFIGFLGNNFPVRTLPKGQLFHYLIPHPKKS